MLIAAPLMLILAAAAAPAPGSDLASSRKTYTACLSDQTKPSLEQKLPLADFRAALKNKCATQEAAFRTAILAANKADGMTAAASQSDADDQVAEYVDKFTSEYEDYLKPS